MLHIMNPILLNLALCPESLSLPSQPFRGDHVFLNPFLLITFEVHNNLIKQQSSLLLRETAKESGEKEKSIRRGKTNKATSLLHLLNNEEEEDGVDDALQREQTRGSKEQGN